MKSATSNQRQTATACLTDMPDAAGSLLEFWSSPDVDNYPAQVAKMRELINDIRSTLNVVEEIVKDDLYRNVTQ